MTTSRGRRSHGLHVLVSLLFTFMRLRKWSRQWSSSRFPSGGLMDRSFPAYHCPPSPLLPCTYTHPFLGLPVGDPGTRARVCADGGGLARFASMPGSIDSPHSRHRHPITASELDNSFIRLTTMRPWQRRHCIESSTIWPTTLFSTYLSRQYTHRWRPSDFDRDTETRTFS
jgi:hypothetical protein